MTLTAAILYASIWKLTLFPLIFAFPTVSCIRFTSSADFGAEANESLTDDDCPQYSTKRISMLPSSAVYMLFMTALNTMLPENQML